MTSPVSMSSPSPFATLQAKDQTAISQRLSTLAQLESSVQSNTTLSTTDKATLLGNLQADVTGLTNLGSQISGDTNASQLHTDSADIYSGFRVYRLVVPQVHAALELAGQQSREASMASSVAADQAQLTSAISSGGSGSQISSDTSLLADATSKLTQVSSALSANPVSELLSVTAAQYNANPSAIAAYTATVASDHQALTGAAGDISSFSLTA